jgi:hypothetical protein
MGSALTFLRLPDCPGFSAAIASGKVHAEHPFSEHHTGEQMS